MPKSPISWLNTRGKYGNSDSRRPHFYSKYYRPMWLPNQYYICFKRYIFPHYLTGEMTTQEMNLTAWAGRKFLHVQAQTAYVWQWCSANSIYSIWCELQHCVIIHMVVSVPKRSLSTHNSTSEITTHELNLGACPGRESIDRPAHLPKQICLLAPIPLAFAYNPRRQGMFSHFISLILSLHLARIVPFIWNIQTFRIHCNGGD